MAEQPPEGGGRRSTYDRWSRPPALSRRGYAIALVGPFVLAAAAFGVVSLVSSGDDSLSGTTIRLPVSGWAPTSSGGDQALIEGVLSVDADDCVYLTPLQRGGNEPDQVWAVWPAGYRATTDQGRVTIYDVDSNPVAHDGDTVRMSGGYSPADRYAGDPCLPDSGEVAVVQSDVTVLQ
ncbi:hypothetical protein [Nocardioides sp.]|uniref:hypothetical protein n=1 Tax=Nocardioides sp. TaxID=35761 RepID=UPI0037848B60